MAKTKKSQITHGNIDLPEDTFTPRTTRQRISIMMPVDIINHFKGKATSDKGYQTLLVEALRDTIERKNHPRSDEVLRAIDTVRDALTQFEAGSKRTKKTV